MKIWAIADLHLSFGIPNKKMDIFGKGWEAHEDKIRHDWLQKVAPNDLVLIAGDISWAMKLKDAIADLEWIDQLPGHKVMIKGNHDYWWPSKQKLSETLPESISAIHNDAVSINGISIGGARLWDSTEYGFQQFVNIQGNSKTLKKEITESDEKQFKKELRRLETSLKAIKQDSEFKIVMTHYPPISSQLKPSQVSSLLERYSVHHCIFGHLHSIKSESLPFGMARGVHYHLTSCDYLNFKLKLIAEL